MTATLRFLRARSTRSLKELANHSMVIGHSIQFQPILGQKYIKISESLKLKRSFALKLPPQDRTHHERLPLA